MEDKNQKVDETMKEMEQDVLDSEGLEKPDMDLEESDILEAAQETSEEEKMPEEETEEPQQKKRNKKRSLRELEIALKKSEEQAAEMTDKYQRLMAEFENARKRTAKETSRMYDVGAKEILEKLLPVVDNFERGLMTLSDEEKELPFVQGIDKIYKQFLTVLSDCHVEAMNAEGKEFNPEFHNAVMHVEDEELGENVVAEELQKGYMYKEMVLRHSMVKVAN
ncbi:MAG: nucleotide exchange factor GrpE [Lachnospiraceae bacterium]|nr:nucleotide exchange factor GrpE [Lachnospiraceae bacterium]